MPRKTYDEEAAELAEEIGELTAKLGRVPSNEDLERAREAEDKAKLHEAMIQAAREGAALANAPVLSVSEAAEFLRCSERTIARLIASGQLRASKPGGGRVLVRRVDLERLLEHS